MCSRACLRPKRCLARVGREGWPGSLVVRGEQRVWQPLHLRCWGRAAAGRKCRPQGRAGCRRGLELPPEPTEAAAGKEQPSTQRILRAVGVSAPRPPREGLLALREADGAAACLYLWSQLLGRLRQEDDWSQSGSHIHRRLANPTQRIHRGCLPRARAPQKPTAEVQAESWPLQAAWPPVRRQH